MDSLEKQIWRDVVDALPGHWLDLAGQQHMDGFLAARLVWPRRTKVWRNTTSLAGRPVRLTGVTFRCGNENRGEPVMSVEVTLIIVLGALALWTEVDKLMKRRPQPSGAAHEPGGTVTN